LGLPGKQFLCLPGFLKPIKDYCTTSLFVINMKINRSISYIHCIIFFAFLSNSVDAKPTNASVKIDTVYINEITTAPAIDGIGNDECWKKGEWYGMNHVWINYGEEIDSSDHYGRFKVVWSKKENLLYFLVETIDDVPVGGYIPGETASIYNYDIQEVFLDENRSKGPNNVTNHNTGKNIENAFAYHIYADFPKKDEVNKTPVVEDIPGPRNDHLPEFAIRGSGTFYTREFSLKVYDSTFDSDDPEFSRVQLEEGKIMGLSLAYCDNDENDGQRDNFFGSVWVPADKYNNHWLEADDFGPAKLISDFIPDKVSQTRNFHSSKIYPNPSSDYLMMNIKNRFRKISVVDILGKTVFCKTEIVYNKIAINISNLKNGLYFIQTTDIAGNKQNEKFVKN
jgi:hypothetical protein